MAKGMMGKKTNALASITATAGEIWGVNYNRVGSQEEKKVKFIMKTWKCVSSEVISFFTKHEMTKRCRETTKPR